MIYLFSIICLLPISFQSSTNLYFLSLHHKIHLNSINYINKSLNCQPPSNPVTFISSIHSYISLIKNTHPKFHLFQSQNPISLNILLSPRPPNFQTIFPKTQTTNPHSSPSIKNINKNHTLILLQTFFPTPPFLYSKSKKLLF